MGLSRDEAQRLRHDYIGTEHILLGLIREGSGIAWDVLGNLDVDLKEICQKVEQLVSRGTAKIIMGQIPFTPRAKRVLELTLEEARNLGHNYMGTEHLLLGLIREQEGIAAEVLDNIGVDIEAARTEVLELLGAEPDEQRTRPPLTDAANATRRSLDAGWVFILAALLVLTAALVAVLSGASTQQAEIVVQFALSVLFGVAGIIYRLTRKRRRRRDDGASL